MSHTPGPWRLVQTDSQDFTAIETRDGLEVLGASEWLRVNPEDLQVMAAAPEMLEALRALLAASLPTDKDANGIDAVQKAISAINKARGKTE